MTKAITSRHLEHVAVANPNFPNLLIPGRWRSEGPWVKGKVS